MLCSSVSHAAICLVLSLMCNHFQRMMVCTILPKEKTCPLIRYGVKFCAAPSPRAVLGSRSNVLLSALRQSAAATPQCPGGDEATTRQTEGPYFKPSSPQRADLVEPVTRAQLVEINGQVLTRSCRPVERALLDLWHADEHGEYGNTASAIADTSLPMARVVTGSAPSCPPLSGPHASLSHQSAGSRAAGAHHPALFPRGARQPARRFVPPRFGDANSRNPEWPRGALRFCRRHAVIGFLVAVVFASTGGKRVRARSLMCAAVSTGGQSGHAGDRLPPRASRRSHDQSIGSPRRSDHRGAEAGTRCSRTPR
jgi:hypothetical protein